jgi:protein-S-isoprenylcysteine O-methyltransferase Ste14
LVTGAVIALAVVLQSAVPLPWPNGALRVALVVPGVCLICLAIAIDAVVFFRFRRAATTILPHRGSTALVTDGPFEKSRNPIYVGYVALTLGVGLAFGNPWAIGLAAVVGVGLQKLAIEPEERHLAARFGADYAAYRARVPRWLLGIGRG